MRRRVHFRVVHLFRLRHALQHQDHRAPHRRHVDRLVRRVQHQYRLLHQRCPARRIQVVGSTACGTFGTGQNLARHFGGVAPPGIHRHVPVCAHRAFLGLSYHSLVLGRGFLTARATVSPATDLAPASRSALAQASSVTPVVNTSSTSKPRTLSTWLPGRVAKAPRTDSHLSSKLSTCLPGRARMRINNTALCGKRSLFARAWRVGPLGCTPAPVLARNAAVLEPPRPPPVYHPPRSPVR